MKKYEIQAYTVKLFKPNSNTKRNFFAVLECAVKEVGQMYIYFVYPGSFIPENSFNQKGKMVQMYIPGEHYEYYLDLLRNEKPVFAIFDWLKPPFIAISTGKEPIGEGEFQWIKTVKEPAIL